VQLQTLHELRAGRAQSWRVPAKRGSLSVGVRAGRLSRETTKGQTKGTRNGARKELAVRLLAIRRQVLDVDISGTLGEYYGCRCMIRIVARLCAWLDLVRRRICG
jgi:hypothetical protein